MKPADNRPEADADAELIAEPGAGRGRTRPREVAALGAKTMHREPGDDVSEPTADLIFEEMLPTDSVRIMRENDVTGDRENHGELTRDKATPDYLAGLFGGGVYRLQLIRRHPKGGRIIHRSMKLTVVGPYKPPTGPLPGAPVITTETVDEGEGNVPGPFRAAGGERMSPREMLDYSAMAKMLQVLNQPLPQAAGVNWAGLAPIVAPFAAALGTILTTVLTREKKPDEAVLLQLQELRDALHAIKAAPGPMTAGLSDLKGAMLAMAEVKDAFRGDDGDKDDGMWTKLLGTAMEVLTKGRDAAAPADATPPPRVLAAGEEPPVTPIPIAAWQRLVNEYRDLLLQSAQSDRDPGMLAGMLAEFCPVNAQGTLRALLQQPNTESLLVTAVPELSEYPTWLTEFVAEARKEVLGDGTDDPSEGAE